MYNNECKVPCLTKYTALGDSLAVGLGAFWGCGYSRLYYKWLCSCKNLRNLCYCNLAVLGWTSGDLLQALRCNCCYRNAVRESCIITLDIGGNDMLRHKYCPERLQEALSCFKKNLCAILAEIRCLNPKATVYVMDIYNPYPCNHPMYATAEPWITAFNEIIWSLAGVQEYRIAGVAPVYSAFRGNELQYTLIARNNVHPSTLGHRAICDCFKTIYVA